MEQTAGQYQAPPRSCSAALAQPGETAGQYLRRQRESAGYGQRQAAASLAALPWAIRPVGTTDITRLALALNSAEEDFVALTRPQAELIANVFDFDAEIYLALLPAAETPEADHAPRSLRSTAEGRTSRQAVAQKESVAA